MHESEKWKWSRSVLSAPQRPHHGLQPFSLLRPWDFLGSLFTAQRLISRDGGKESLLYFWDRQTVQRSTPLPNPPTALSVDKSFYRQGKGTCAKTVYSALTIILKLVVWWSDQCHSDCFKYSHSSVPGSACSHIAWGQFSELWQHILAIVFSSCS